MRWPADRLRWGRMVPQHGHDKGDQSADDAHRKSSKTDRRHVVRGAAIGVGVEQAAEESTQEEHVDRCAAQEQEPPRPFPPRLRE